MTDKLDAKIRNKINSQRRYGVGMSLQTAYREYQISRGEMGRFYGRMCMWLLIERLCSGRWVYESN